MRLADLVYAPWAITPQMHSEVMAIYERHCRGEKIDIKGLEASIGRPLANEPAPYTVDRGVAVLEIEGVIAKRMTLLSQISGGASSSYVGQQFQTAIQDPAVKAIILAIDSPGGAVDGTQELSTLIAGARGTKPVVAFTDGMMASAAYWIGSAADQIFISGDTTLVGSIGVITAHTDQSGADAQRGRVVTPITAGKYKAMAHEHAPLSKEGLAMIQERLDAIYTAFVNDVARNRCSDPATVLEDMADGRVFTGKEAIEAGLVDGVSTLEDLVAQLSEGGLAIFLNGAGAALQPTTTATGAIPAPTATHKENPMDPLNPQAASESVKCPDCGKTFDPSKNKAELNAIKLEGATEERARIQAVLAAGLPGHEALIQKLAFDGKTTGPEAAMIVVQAERTKLNALAQTIAAEAPKPLPNAVAPVVPPNAEEADANLPLEERCKAKWTRDPAVREEFGNLGAYTAFERANSNGQVHILGKK